MSKKNGGSKAVPTDISTQLAKVRKLQEAEADKRAKDCHNAIEALLAEHNCEIVAVPRLSPIGRGEFTVSANAVIRAKTDD